MKHLVQFISLDEDDKDLILSFAVDDGEMEIKSLILHRALFFEHFLDEEERGVKVSFEGDSFDQEDINMLSNISIGSREIKVTTPFREYHLDISKIEQNEIDETIELLKKQNYDDRFTIQTD
jgi:hypothetical protein